MVELKWFLYLRLQGVVNQVGWDHTEFMVLPLPLDDVYRESILGFSSKKALVSGTRLLC